MRYFVWRWNNRGIQCEQSVLPQSFRCRRKRKRLPKWYAHPKASNFWMCILKGYFFFFLIKQKHFSNIAKHWQVILWLYGEWSKKSFQKEIFEIKWLGKEMAEFDESTKDNMQYWYCGLLVLWYYYDRYAFCIRADSIGEEIMNFVRCFILMAITGMIAFCRANIVETMAQWKRFSL